MPDESPRGGDGKAKLNEPLAVVIETVQLQGEVRREVRGR
jgi:hypothetical protein